MVDSDARLWLKNIEQEEKNYSYAPFDFFVSGECASYKGFTLFLRQR